jgi:hypothetical protein
VCGPIFKASVFSERVAHFLSAGADYTPRKIAMRAADRGLRLAPRGGAAHAFSAFAEHHAAGDKAA